MSEEKPTKMELFEELGLKGCLNDSGITCSNYKENLKKGLGKRKMSEIEKDMAIADWMLRVESNLDAMKDRIEELELNVLYWSRYEPKHRLQDTRKKMGYEMTLTQIP